MISRSWPIRIIDLIRLPALFASSSMLAPFANPPAIQMTLKYESNDAIAACGLVAFESSTQFISPLLRTSSIR